MELFPGLRVIDAPFENGRQINLWLCSGRRTMLVDSGVAGVPAASILPYLSGIGLSARDLDLLVNLHAHADHVGGDAELLAASGGRLRIGAHRLDAPAIANHRLLATEVYGLSDEDRIQTLLKRCGADVPVGERYAGGEVIALGGSEWQVIHVPGHTAGNIALYNPVHRALIHGESVMGASQANERGERSTPFGADPQAYRQGLGALKYLEMDWFLSSHKPPADGAAGKAAIAESLAAVDEFERTCRAALAQGVRDVEEFADIVAREGRYQAGPRLLKQVGNTLGNWVAAGIVRRAASGEYRLAKP